MNLGWQSLLLSLTLLASAALLETARASDRVQASAPASEGLHAIRDSQAASLERRQETPTEPIPTLAETEAAVPPALLYPDLRTMPPADLHFALHQVEGRVHFILRFSNFTWNAGEGPLELLEASQVNTDVSQVIFDEGGGWVQRPSGTFIFHPTHQHWHFEDFSRYQVWGLAEYYAWLDSGRTEGQPFWEVSKSSSCLMDGWMALALPGTPPRQTYPERCAREIQGISVGWGDVYYWFLPEHWVDVGETPPPDGIYILRSVVDPFNRIFESPDGLDPARDGDEANEAVVPFYVQGGYIVPLPE